MKQNGRYMDMIHPSAKMRKVSVQVKEDISVNVVKKVTERAPEIVERKPVEEPPEDVLPEVVEATLEETAMPQEENASDFDFDKELEKAFEGVDFSDDAFKTENMPEDNIADIEEAAAQMFVDESVPILEETGEAAKPDEVPDANNFSLGSSANPFLPGARVDKRPLGLNVKPGTESANITESTKNVYARREMLRRPEAPMSAERPTMIVENPKKKDHGFLWALLIIFVTLLGAGAGALVYYLVYNN
jgi:hypothetical protein